MTAETHPTTGPTMPIADHCGRRGATNTPCCRESSQTPQSFRHGDETLRTQSGHFQDGISIRRGGQFVGGFIFTQPSDIRDRPYWARHR